MRVDRLEASSLLTKRARGYLRWYPGAWRIRYGEEFVAHLEAELTERPHSLTRGVDIALHGFSARLSMQRGLRNAMRGAAVIILLTALSVTALVLVRSWSPVVVTTGADSTGSALAVTPSQVTAFSFNFSSPAPRSIRITGVRLIPLTDFDVPRIVGVEFAARADRIGMVEGWPVRLNSTQARRDGRVTVVPAYGATVNLTHSNAIWVGLSAPLTHHAYAVEGLAVTYKRGALTHTFTIGKGTTPDVICGVSHPRTRTRTIARWCNPEIDAANLIATNLKGSKRSLTWISGEATVVAQLAVDQTYAFHRVPSLRELRYWASQFFPARASDGVQRITSIVVNQIPEWRFAIARGATKRLVSVCTSRPRLLRNGFEGVEVRSC
ncbi:MAG: hypothetical protein ACYDEH_06680 [Acidimicrobiales bacterium]